MKYILVLCLLLSLACLQAQELKIRPRKAHAPAGSAFAHRISDTLMSLKDREDIIFKEVRSGNVPDFYRNLVAIRDTAGQNVVEYYVLPDFLAIGSDSDHFYCPMTAGLAQRVADLLDCSLPTRKISDDIYMRARVKMVPEPIPPTPAMVTVPVFLKHNELVRAQREQTQTEIPLGALVAGNKKDVVVSNKIINDKGMPRVVIYGWHKPDGKAIQPLYNGHKPDWVDYSHGIRLIQKKVWVNGKVSTVQKVLKSPEFHGLLSDEGMIANPSY